MVTELLNKAVLTRDDLIAILDVSDADMPKVLDRALQVKQTHVGRKVYLRGLIELSNKCAKNCYYCGIRSGNPNVHRYTLAKQEVLNAAQFAWKNGFGSLVIQSGELSTNAFADLIEELLHCIHKQTNHELSITLSCGEQPKKVFQRWRAAGAHRYLLRVETTNQELYYQIHPHDRLHAYENRLQALKDLRESGFQVGTGVMIGLPGQTTADLADDLLFFRSLDIDMVGMGPYVEHAETPLFAKADQLWPLGERFKKSLLMIALLRLMMPDINIAASTALETADKMGRQRGLLAGANVVMPNLTPVVNRIDYQLYNNKPNLDKDPYLSTDSLKQSIESIGETIGYHEPGNSFHYLKRTSR